jgi:glycosyltransferase involved in cell wall biosynthesis
MSKVMPFWSIVIPVIRLNNFLSKAIDSISKQDFQEKDYELILVDNSGSDLHLADYCHDHNIICKKLRIYKQTCQVPMAKNWNTCIELCNGEYIHILHDDDWIMPGFYSEVQRLIESNPNYSLFATRTIFCDESGIHGSENPRFPILEKGGKDATEIYLDNKLMCPGVVIKRSAYTALGGFDESYNYVMDGDMWARTIRAKGGIVSPKALACYRVHPDSSTSKFSSAALNLLEKERLYEYRSKAYSDFSHQDARKHLIEFARRQERLFLGKGDKSGAKANRSFWWTRSSRKEKCQYLMMDFGKKLQTYFKRVISIFKVQKQDKC